MEYTATIVSLVSLSVAMLTLGWTIYRDAVQKPRFRVSIDLKYVHQAGYETEGPFIFVEAVNLGPSPNRLGMPRATMSWWQRRTNPKDSTAFIYPDFSHMSATPADSRIDVGDMGTFVFPYDKECFLKLDCTRVGVADGYGRVHWAPRSELRRARDRYRERFQSAVD